MAWFRSWIGLPSEDQNNNTQQPQSVLENTSIEERQASLLKKQRLDLKKNRAELAEVNADLQAAIDAGDQPEAKRLLTRARVLKREIDLLQGQVANVEAAQRTLTAAQTNKEQALLMRDGANRLAQHVQEAERIDVDDIVDTFQDGAQQTHEMSSRLSEPLVPMDVYALNEEGEGIDEELERMMLRNADAKTVGMPSAPTSNNNGGGTSTVVTQRKVAAKEKNN